MKNLVALIILSIVVFGCSKSNQKTTNTTTPPPSTSSTNTPTLSTANETALVGKWVIKKMVTWMYVDSMGGPNNNIGYNVPYYAKPHDSTFYNNPSILHAAVF